MTEEIKEILDDLGNKDKYIEEFGYQYKRISLYDSFQLLDYITNLQQENEDLKTIIKQYVDIVLHDRKEIDRLQQENEFLKLNNPEMNIEHFRIVKENKRKIDNLRKENERLNNIINELEKWLDDNIEYGDDDYYDMKAIGVESALNKLKELKGSDEE